MLALAQIPDRSRIRVRIVGEGDYSDGLRKLIAAHRLEETVEFDNRLYPLREIPRVLSDCHVGLVPLDVTPISDFALPLKLIEYTCLGLPSITVSTTAITHYLRPDECMMYTPGDVTGLSRLIEGTVKDPDRLAGYRAKLGQARERMSWSRERFKYMALLDGLVTEKGDASSKRSGCA